MRLVSIVVSLAVLTGGMSINLNNAVAQVSEPTLCPETNLQCVRISPTPAAPTKKPFVYHGPKRPAWVEQQFKGNAMCPKRVPYAWGKGKYRGQDFQWVWLPPCGSDFDELVVSIEIRSEDNAELGDLFGHGFSPNGTGSIISIDLQIHVYKDEFIVRNDCDLADKSQCGVSDNGYVRTKTDTELAKEIVDSFDRNWFFRQMTTSWVATARYDLCLEHYVPQLERREMEMEAAQKRCGGHLPK